MVEIRPFKALMYDWDEVDGGPSAVTSPPYDVISEADVARLKKRSLHNVTRITMPSPARGKDPSTRYERAAGIIKRWKKEGILHQRKEPALFAYSETHGPPEDRRTIHGFFALLRLDPAYGEVLPHERTHKGPIEDRLELLRATDTDLEPIQFLYKDAAGKISAFLQKATDEKAAPPFVDYEDPAGLGHKLWAVEDAEAIEDVTSWLATEKVYIADGHHRYATALQYAKERRDDDDSDADEPAPYEYKLALFVAENDPGMAVYATHRLIYGLDDVAAARQRLQDRFATEPLQVDGDSEQRARSLEEGVRADDDVHRFAFYWGDGDADVLTLSKEDVDRAALGDHSDAWKDLDVSVLHSLVLRPTIGVDADNAGDHLRYTRIPAEAVEAVDRGEHQLAIFMNPTPLPAVTAVADAGDYMPQKSTYFQPKAASGLLFSPLG